MQGCDHGKAERVEPVWAIEPNHRHLFGHSLDLYERGDCALVRFHVRPLQAEGVGCRHMISVL